MPFVSLGARAAEHLAIAAVVDSEVDFLLFDGFQFFMNFQRRQQECFHARAKVVKGHVRELAREAVIDFVPVQTQCCSHRPVLHVIEFHGPFADRTGVAIGTTHHRIHVECIAIVFGYFNDHDKLLLERKEGHTLFVQTNLATHERPQATHVVVEPATPAFQQFLVGPYADHGRFGQLTVLFQLARGHLLEMIANEPATACWR